MLILGIETSCDETACAIVRSCDNRFEVLSSVVSSQIKFHAPWGGVVPNLAARKHLENILPVIQKALKKARIAPKDIDLVAVTQGPGLIPALLVGTQTAKAFSYLWQKPLLGIHHIEGHIYANFIGGKIDVSSKIQSPKSKQKTTLNFPLLCLVVSGGHTQLVFMKKHLHYEIIGQTVDDAAGEAFDKVARILGLGYPGGPAIAQKAKLKMKNEKFKIKLPRPMLNSNNFNFSFSGLKTAVLYETQKHPQLLKNNEYIATISREFQQSVVEVLVKKTIAAAKKYGVKTIMLAGGVSANKELRRQLTQSVRKNFSDIACQMPRAEYSLDNAVMIALAAFFRWEKNKEKKTFQNKIKNNWKNFDTQSNLTLK